MSIILHSKSKRTIDDLDTKYWYLNDKLHREDGPAIEWFNGDKAWCLNDRLHREDGPAIEFFNGDKYWYLNGKLHRTDGPAVEHTNGSKSWFLNGVRYTKSEFNAKMNPNSCEGKEVEIDGKTYVLKLKD